MKKCKYIGKQFFTNYEITYNISYNKYYYFIKREYEYVHTGVFTQYELYKLNDRDSILTTRCFSFITTVPKDIFEKDFIDLKQERKLKLQKINENWR